MQITFKLFASLRELTNTSELCMESVAPLSCADALTWLTREFPCTASTLGHSTFARNGAFVRKETILENGDELAILPPVSGG